MRFDYLLTGKTEVALASAAAAKEYASVYTSMFEGAFGYYANLSIPLNIVAYEFVIFKITIYCVVSAHNCVHLEYMSILKHSDISKK